MVLKYQEPNIVFMTIIVEEDTPLGLYTLTIDMEGKGMEALFWITIIQ